MGPEINIEENSESFKTYHSFPHGVIHPFFDGVLADSSTFRSYVGGKRKLTGKD